MNPKTIEVIGEEPVTIAEARQHIESPAYGDSDVDSADSLMIEGFISAAREYCEQFLGLSLVTKTLEIAMDEFPDDEIELPFGPVREIIQTRYGSETDDLLTADDYTLDTYSRVARLTPVTQWPSVTAATNAIKIRYLAGYGVDSDGGEEIPKAIRAAILLIVGHLYANREDSTDKVLTVVPVGADMLMQPYRARLGFA